MTADKVLQILLSPHEAIVLAMMIDGACEQLMAAFSELGPEERLVVLALQTIRKQIPQ